jgi:hypothetical protein
MTLDQMRTTITQATTVAAATTALLTAITAQMRDAEALSEWTQLADLLDAAAPELSQAVAAAHQP